MVDYSMHLKTDDRSNSSVPRMGDSQTLPLEFVIWAYRLFLDREPEDLAVAERPARTLYRSAQLRKAFLASPEYAAKGRDASVSGTRAPHTTSPKLPIERISDRAALLSFFQHVQRTWTTLGETEPHWSVLSGEQFRQANLAEHIQEFMVFSRNEINRLFDLLDAKGIAVPRQSTCIEYGCGVGRVTRWLSERFSRVVACDISDSHIQLARKYVADEGRDNISFNLIGSIEEIENLPPAEFFYSVLVLQHNPPPIIEVIVSSLAKALKPGGYGLFQVPTHCDGYSFSVGQYLARLANPAAKRSIEMHLLPKERAFKLIHETGCLPVDVFEDDWAGPDYESLSFLIHKPEA